MDRKEDCMVQIAELMCKYKQIQRTGGVVFAVSVYATSLRLETMEVLFRKIRTILVRTLTYIYIYTV